MRQRDPFLAIASVFLLLLVTCLNARAGDGGRTVIRRTPPVYPQLARQMRVVGCVVLVVSIAPDGSVGDVKVQSGHPLLIQAATDAVKQWRFAPAPQPTESTVSVNFEAH